MSTKVKTNNFSVFILTPPSFDQENLQIFTIFKVNSISWGRGQPNNYNQEQNCAVLDSDLDYGWNDLSCRISALAVCRGRPSKCASPSTNEGTTVTVHSDRKRYN